MALAFVCVLLTGTSGELEYFSPYTLELRTQSEFTLLLGALPVYRSSLAPVDNELVAFVQGEGFVVRQPPSDQRRILVFHQNRAWKDGYCTLYDVLHRYRERIIEWSKQDRQRAQIYWSEGFGYLRSDNPTEVPIGEAILAYGYRFQSIEELEACIASITKEWEM